MRRLVPLLLLLLLLLPSAARAAGPFEPNDRASRAGAPLVAPQVDAALETSTDVDWYLLAPRGERQIDVMATLLDACPSAAGSVRVAVYDPDLTVFRAPLWVVRLGRDPSDPFTAMAPRVAGTLRFLSVPGHRFLVSVRQSRCAGAHYHLDLGPVSALGPRLRPTPECRRARRLHAHEVRVRACARHRLRGAPWE